MIKLGQVSAAGLQIAICIIWSYLDGLLQAGAQGAPLVLARAALGFTWIFLYRLIEVEVKDDRTT